jgi:primosomal protein N''
VAIKDPLSRLVAAGAVFRANRATPQVIAAAVDTASEQGWRRPLLAWLNVQALRAEKAGDTAEAARLRRRIALASE